MISTSRDKVLGMYFFVHASGNLEYFAGAIFDNLGFVKLETFQVSD